MDLKTVLSNCDAKRDGNYSLGADSFTITTREYAILKEHLSTLPGPSREPVPPSSAVRVGGRPMTLRECMEAEENETVAKDQRRDLRDAVIEECAIIARRHWIECAGLAGSKTANSIAQEIEALKGSRAATGEGS